MRRNCRTCNKTCRRPAFPSRAVPRELDGLAAKVWTPRENYFVHLKVGIAVFGTTASKSALWGFHKWGYPKIIHFNRSFLHKPSILGYHHLWNPPLVPQAKLKEFPYAQFAAAAGSPEEPIGGRRLSNASYIGPTVALRPTHVRLKVIRCYKLCVLCIRKCTLQPPEPHSCLGVMICALYGSSGRSKAAVRAAHISTWPCATNMETVINDVWAILLETRYTSN